jgi:hypothetical protein
LSANEVAQLEAVVSLNVASAERDA